MAGVLKLVNVGPYLSLPAGVMRSSFSTGGAARMEGYSILNSLSRAIQFNENTADFLDFFVSAQQVFIAQQVAKPQLFGFHLGFGASEEGSVLGA